MVFSLFAYGWVDVSRVRCDNLLEAKMKRSAKCEVRSQHSRSCQRDLTWPRTSTGVHRHRIYFIATSVELPFTIFQTHFPKDVSNFGERTRETSLFAYGWA